MFKQTLCRAALGFALSAALGVGSSAQEAEIANYAQGANYFSAGAYAEASSVFDRIVASQTDDPRVYFLRGLCAARQNDATSAAEFYAVGARLEISTEKGRLSNVDGALTSIQGGERIPIEEARTTARAEWKAQETARQRALYGESLVAQRARLATAPPTSYAAKSADAPKDDALAAAPIRPFARTETPAHRVPDLYDKSSDALKYFTDDLGKPELSTKAKARLKALAERDIYQDPMDKPAADGTPFINIYDASEIFNDGEPFVGDDDADEKYKADEENVLNTIAEQCDFASAVLSSQLASGAQNSAIPSSGASNAYPGALMPDAGPMATSGSTGPGSAGPGSAGPDAQTKAVEKSTAPSAADDTKLLFQDAKPADSPFQAAVSLDAANDFDLFKADRDFKPVANASGYGPGSGSSSGMPMPSPGAMGPDSSSPAAPNK